MNLRDEILKEHSKQHALKIAEYACQSKSNFKELMRCFLDDEYRLSQRAACLVVVKSVVAISIIKFKSNCLFDVSGINAF